MVVFMGQVDYGSMGAMAHPTISKPQAATQLDAGVVGAEERCVLLEGMGVAGGPPAISNSQLPTPNFQTVENIGVWESWGLGR
jgi:hypothetical protein